MLLLSVFILLLVRHVLAAREHPLIIITGILAGRGGEACLFFFCVCNCVCICLVSCVFYNICVLNATQYKYRNIFSRFYFGMLLLLPAYNDSIICFVMFCLCLRLHIFITHGHK